MSAGHRIIKHTRSTWTNNNGAQLHEIRFRTQSESLLMHAN